jgi:acyl carrier protein
VLQVKQQPSAGNSRAGDASPSRDQIRALVMQLLHEICAIPRESIAESASIENELQMESIQLVDLQVALEHELDVTIDLIEILELNTLGKVIDYLYDQTVRSDSP